MKKLAKLTSLLIAVLSCFIFVSCGKDYSKLNMKFFVSNNETNKIVLTIDENNPNSTLNRTRVTVDISGIDAGDVGELNVYTTNNVAEVSNKQLAGKTLVFDLTAKRASLSGSKLSVTHMRSNQTFSIDLIVKKRTDSVDLLNNGKVYVVAIKDDNRTLTINSSSLVAINGTDEVKWATESSLPDGITVAGGDKTSFTKLNVSKDVIDGKEIEIFPVTKLDGFDAVQFSNKKIKLRFVKLPTSDTIKVNATIGETSLKDINSNAELLIVPNDEEYKQAQIGFEDTVTINGGLKLAEYYDQITSSFDRDNVSGHATGNGIIVETSNTETTKVSVKLSSSKYIGEIAEITKTFKVKAVYKAGAIAVKRDGKILPIAGGEVSFDIFNSYSNSKGTALNFITTLYFDNDDTDVTTAGVDNAYKRVRIHIDKGLLYAGDYIYTDSNFNTTEKDTGGKGPVLLEFYNSKGEYLKFCNDRTNNDYVSEAISGSNVVYVKYVLTADINATRAEGEKFSLDTTKTDLTFDVINFYADNTAYLKGLTASTKAVLNTKPSVVSYENNNSTMYLAKGTDSFDIKIVAKDIDGESILGIGVDLMVETGELNVVEKRNSANIYGQANIPTTSLWEYINNGTNATDENSTLTISSTGLSVGSYQLKVYQEGTGYDPYILNVVVYEDFSSIDVDFPLSQSSYIYKGSDVDFIVPYIDYDFSFSSVDMAYTGIVSGYEFSISGGHNEIIAATDRENQIKLNFRKINLGTTVPTTITLTTTVEKLKIENHLASGTENVSTSKTFYIYNKINSSDLSLNGDDGDKCARESLCGYDISQNQQMYTETFELGLLESKKTDITNITWFVKYNYGAKVPLNGSFSGDYCSFVATDDYNYTINYAKAGVFEIVVELMQFNQTYSLRIIRSVESAVITEAIKLNNENVYIDVDGERYIELKDGETFSFNIESQSTLGRVTNHGYIILVVDDDGNKVATLNDLTLTANINYNKKRVLILARDALRLSPGLFDNTPSVLLDSGYSRAYLSIRVRVSNGTAQYPYLIKSAEDFWTISTTDSDKYYEIMSDINIGAYKGKQKINGFVGTISTKNNAQLSLEGLTLNRSLQNVFTDFGGTLSNVTFSVKFDYELSTGNLGIIGSTSSSASLTNVCIEVDESSKIKCETDIVFGALVGSNAGTIKYTNNNLCGVSGKVTINGDGKTVIIGGLVGENTGTITGAYSPNAGGENEIVYASSSVKSGYTSSIAFDLSRFKDDSKVGGLVGNNSGAISNVAVISTITNNDKTAYNIGGVIGTNTSKTLAYIKSASTIFGGQNIGGITGSDKSGEYEHCMYQIRYNASYSQPNLSGTDNVGGIIGNASNSALTYCSTYSYRWDYSQALEGTDDIHANSYAGGLIGSGTSTNTSCSVNALINGITSNDPAVTDNLGKPIIEVAPTSISMTAQSNYRLTDDDDDKLWLEYYRFVSRLNGIESVEISAEEMHSFKAYFEKNIDETGGLLNVICVPDSIGTIELMVTSSDRSVIDWTTGGKIKIKGTGTATLTLTSVLNPSVKASVTVVVVDALAQSGHYIITDVKDSREGLTEDAVGKSKPYYLSYDKDGDILKNGDLDYKYLPNINLGVTVVGASDYAEYARINGKPLTTASIDIGNENTISLEVIKRQPDEDDRLNITFTPFLYELGVKHSINQNIALEVDTRVGLTDLSLAHTGKVLYPSETVTLDVTLYTDKTLVLSDIIGLIRIKQNGEYLDSVSGILSFVFENLEENTQIVHITITNPVLTKDQPKQELLIEFSSPNGNIYTASYLLLPERIDNISIQNYLVAEGSSENPYNQPTDYIMDGYQNFLIIKMSPETAFFDYVEIRDITGNEELGFMQLTDLITRHTIDREQMTADGKGIRLIKGLSNSADEMYVLIVLSEQNTYEHEIEIRAYAETESGDVLLSSKIFNIYVQMRPDVDVIQRLPNGEQLKIQFVNNKATIYDATGVNINFIVNKRNADRMDKDEDRCEFYNTSGSFYTFQRTNNDGDATVTFTLTTTTKDGRVIREVKTITFKEATFVIHSVSVTPSTSGKITGHLGVDTPIEFYFDRNDISYFDSVVGAFSTVYYSGNKPSSPSTPIKEIYEILDAINSAKNNIISIDKDDKIELKTESGYSVVVSTGYNRSTELKLKLNLKFENKTFKYDASRSDAIITKDWTFNFQNASIDKGTAIHDQQEFEEMINGEKYYLANDITLINYTPIDVDLVWFNGDGKKITIKSFANFTSPDINAGLFETIYPNMLVENLTVEYPKNAIGSTSVRYEDLCSRPEEVEYTSASFGGIAVTNYGMITNCKVQGSVSLRASTVEAQYVDGYNIAFNIGGIVAYNEQNSGTGLRGSITNSSSSLKIYALANIGGIAYTNNGVIASAGVSLDAKFYTYNEQVTQSISAEVGALVVNNNYRIDMCYVESSKDGNASAMIVKDIASGFVYTNTGSITNSYSRVDYPSYNNNFYGFVFNNSGSIENCYSYINLGLANNNNVYMFANAGTTGIMNCIEVSNRNDSNGFNDSEVAVVKTAEIGDKVKFAEHGFSFGENNDSVWTVLSYPRLNSTLISINVNNLIGTKYNPYLVYDIETWNGIKNYPNGYIRIIRDLDFSEVNENPKTSDFIFSGSIEGNSMSISNIMIYSNENLGVIGLFAELKRDSGIVGNRIANLNLSTRQITATKTNAVGLLAGVIADYKLFNISIDTKGTIILGGNAVGGLAGVIKGGFELENIYSNASVNSTKLNTAQATLYLGSNNYMIDSNLTKVYYAGSIAGILDGYDNSTTVFNWGDDTVVKIVKDKFFVVRNIKVDGDVIVIGDIVGSAFGFVGEFVSVDNVDIKLLANSKLKGQVYSGGIIGENRGKLTNATIYFDYEDYIKGSTAFTKSEPTVTFTDTVAVGGAVGLNIGGLVRDVDVYNMYFKDYRIGRSGGGIVGKNVNGTVVNSQFDGRIESYIIGLIIGEETSGSIVKAYSGVAGITNAINNVQQLDKVPKYLYVNLKGDIDSYINLDSNIIKGTTIDWYLNNNTKFMYLVDAPSGDSEIHRRSAFGLLIGVDCASSRKIHCGVFGNGDTQFRIVKTAELEYNTSLSEINDSDNHSCDNNRKNWRYNINNTDELSGLLFFIGDYGNNNFNTWDSIDEYEKCLLKFIKSN